MAADRVPEANVNDTKVVGSAALSSAPLQRPTPPLRLPDAPPGGDAAVQGVGSAVPDTAAKPLVTENASTALALSPQPAAGSGDKPADAAPCKEFGEIPLPGMDSLAEPAQSTGAMTENAEVTRVIRQILAVAETKKLIVPAAVAKEDKYLPRHPQPAIRHSGPFSEKQLQQQYRMVMTTKEKPLRTSSIPLRRLRWLQAVRDLFRFLEDTAGRRDTYFDGLFTYMRSHKQDRAGRVHGKDKDRAYWIEKNPPVQPIVLAVLDRAWELAQAGPDNITFYVTNRDIGDQHSWGFSADLFLGPDEAREEDPLPDTGLWDPKRVVRLIGYLEQAARERKARINIYYNDSSVARAANDDNLYVKLKMQDASNWHGPAPYILHLHLDVVPA